MCVCVLILVVPINEEIFFFKKNSVATTEQRIFCSAGSMRADALTTVENKKMRRRGEKEVERGRK